MRRYTITVNDTAKVIDVEAVGANLFRIQVDGRLVDVELTDHRDLGHGSITPAVHTRAPAPGARTTPAAPTQTPTPTASGPAGGLAPRTAGAASGAPAGSHTAAPASGGGGRDKMTAPMPGVILSVGIAVGATVKRGDPLLVLEAMKMKNELRAPRDGVVAEVYVAAGQQVRFGEFLVRFEA